MTTSCSVLKKRANQIERKYRKLVTDFKPSKNSIKDEKRVNALGKKFTKITNQLNKKRCEM